MHAGLVEELRLRRRWATFPFAAGIALILLGSAVVAGWILHVPMLLMLLPGFIPMAISTAVAFILAGLGVCLFSETERRGPEVTGIGIALMTLAALVLAEHATGVETGTDLKSLQAWLPRVSAHPGLMAAATACAFALVAATLLVAPRVSRPAAAAFVKASTVVVGCIGVLGIAGYLVKAQLLFPRYFFSGLAMHTCLGLIVLAAGLMSAWQRFPWGRTPLFARDDDRITFQGASILAAIAFVGGILSFAILQGRVQSLVTDNVVASLTRRTELFEDLIQLREMNARIVATRPAVILNLRAIREGSDGSGANLANIRAVVAGFLDQGYSAVAYLDKNDNVVASAGTFVESPAVVAPLLTPSNAELIWSDGFLLRNRIPMRDSAGPVGTASTEQPLSVLTRLSRKVLGMGETGDMGLCFARDDMLHCFPQRLSPRAFSVGMLNAAGEPLPMARALHGESGNSITRDYRGENVVAAYGPVGELGLGMVVKIDAAEIFLPIRERLEIVIAVLACLVTAGTLLLRSRLKPLATKLMDAEAITREKNVELARANEAKDRFLASMSHELRTPLNAIIGFTGTLLMRLPGPLNAEQDKQLKTVQTGGRHLLALINDLLDLAKIEAGKVELKLEPCACREIVEEVADALRPEAEAKGLQFIVEVPAQDLVVRTDRRALSQIILNLASNAIKFTGRGSVRLRLCSRELGVTREVSISVEDTGIGISPEGGEKLFAAFAQVDVATRRHEGTGLGLHLSQKLAELLGGRIVFRSEPGEGSAFTLILVQEATLPPES
jgi:signal transduction histidine kinase